MHNEPNVAIFASGGGSNFQALVDKKDEGRLHVTFACVIGNNSNARAFERATQRGIPTIHCAPGHFDDEESYACTLLATLKKYSVDLIVLAGYMKKIPFPVIHEFRNRIINIHPGLLPAFGGKGMYGKKVHQAVIDYGSKISGITVHFVDEEYDHGPIILQETIPVSPTDDADALAEKVLKIEHANFWRAVEACAHGTVRVEGRKVFGVV